MVEDPGTVELTSVLDVAPVVVAPIDVLAPVDVDEVPAEVVVEELEPLPGIAGPDDVEELGAVVAEVEELPAGADELVAGLEDADDPEVAGTVVVVCAETAPLQTIATHPIPTTGSNPKARENRAVRLSAICS